ncbi:MAG: hypothetical protein FJ276_34910, partial [Planctomycetes bacterium]|nr:hypothetical protein [Planctomycetota bacterium]
ARYRGLHRFDLAECKGCGQCARVCPVDCGMLRRDVAGCEATV